MSVLGTCQDCGAKYRVPSAERTYSCKACGGTVVAAEAPEHDPEPEEREERPRRSRKSSGDGMRVAIYAMVGVLLLGGAYWFTTREAEAAVSGATDINQAMASFDQAWEAGNVEGIGALMHPQQASTLKRQLTQAKENRGWTGGFPGVTSSAKRQATGDDVDAMLMAEGEDAEGEGEDAGPAKPKTTTTNHATADGEIVCFWQYSQAKSSWFMYAIEIPPPALAPRLEAFRTAWNGAKEDDIRSFLTPDKEDALMQAFEKARAKLNWEEPFLKMEDSVAEMNDAQLGMVGVMGRYPQSVKVYCTTERGKISFRWALDRDADTWFVKTISPRAR